MIFEDFVLELFVNLPALLTLAGCMIFTLASRHRHPPAARWALLGFGWLFITDITAILWRTVGIGLVLPNLPPLDLEEVLSLIVLSIFESAAYLFLAIALFVARTPYRPRHYYDYDDAADDQRRR
jgi:hypothetical protein